MFVLYESCNCLGTVSNAHRKQLFREVYIVDHGFAASLEVGRSTELVQMNDEQSHVICYASRPLSRLERSNNGNLR